MKPFLLLILFLVPLAWSWVIQSKFASACSAISATNYTTGCSIDLTVAVDMSTAMGNIANIATLTDSVLNKLLPGFNFNETYTAGITFGASAIGASDYYNNYGDICNYIHTQEEAAIQMGLSYASLSSVFEIYENNLMRTGRNYKKVLVLLSAITDSSDINAALAYANNLRDFGVYIIVGALGQFSNSQLAGLGDEIFYAPDFTIPYLNVTDEACQFGGYTIYPTGTTPSFSQPTNGPYDDRSDAIGSPCSTNISVAWVDIVLVIDVSNAMNHETLNQLYVTTSSYMSNMPFGQPEGHTTRAAIVTYARNTTIRYNLIDVTNYGDFDDALFNIMNYNDPSDSGVNAQGGLRAAYNMIQAQQSNRRKAIILTAAAYNKDGFAGASEIAQTIKDDGITIITITFDDTNAVLTGSLGDLASPGYNYTSSKDDLSDSLALAITQVNCFCPSTSLQLQTWNAIGRNFSVYADCIWGSPNEGKPSIIARHGCIEGNNIGHMSAITSQAKLDFVLDNILPHDLIGKKQFLIGGHKNGSEWLWYGYGNKDTYPLGRFPYLNVTSSTHQWSYMSKGFGFSFNMYSTDDTPKPYLCEIKACDAENYCP